MNALAYLLLTQLKNRILSLRKKPGLLILYLITAAFLILCFVVLLISDYKPSHLGYADERIIFSIIAGIGLLFLWSFVSNGLSNGSSLFSMSDVGLLFVAPISTKKILMYGLISSLGKAMLANIFVIFQMSNLRSNFGYGLKEVFALFIICAVMTLFCQLMSIGIYIISNGNPARKNIIKGIIIALFSGIAIMVLIIQRQEGLSLIKAVLSLPDTKWFGYIPVAGWSMMFFIGIAQGSVVTMLIPLILYFISGSIIILLLTSGTADYYEDVLLSTEITYQTQKTIKEEGKTIQNRKKKIKVSEKAMGLNKGMGAMTIAYKHLLELKRTSKLMFIDSFTLFAAFGVGVAAYYLVKVTHLASYIILATAIYLQFFMTVMGKLKSELLKPYIYLIPEKSVKKLFAASFTSIVKPCIDGIIMFSVLVVMGGTDPLTGLFYALAYASSGALFVGFTILYQRVLGGQPNNYVKMLFGVGFFLIIISPAIISSIAVSFLLPEALDFLCTLPYSICCMVFTGLIFLTCGGLLDKAEYTGKS